MSEDEYNANERKLLLFGEAEALRSSSKKCDKVTPSRKRNARFSVWNGYETMSNQLNVLIA